MQRIGQDYRRKDQRWGRQQWMSGKYAAQVKVQWKKWTGEGDCCGRVQVRVKVRLGVRKGETVQVLRERMGLSDAGGALSVVQG